MKNTSKLYFRDGTMRELEPKLAYALWLVTPGSVIRVYGDTTPVYSWEWRPKGVKST